MKGTFSSNFDDLFWSYCHIIPVTHVLLYLLFSKFNRGWWLRRFIWHAICIHSKSFHVFHARLLCWWTRTNIEFEIMKWADNGSIIIFFVHRILTHFIDRYSLSSYFIDRRSPGRKFELITRILWWINDSKSPSVNLDEISSLQTPVQIEGTEVMPFLCAASSAFA